ncbi:MAG: beta-ketoacyl-[acyl-carrier-protein] synthase family protein [Candidatus Aureabacteria bacterium]|nr:beta-ketoacyl-[acyl-carrier-protein] synthase family protein [Candidatus Auribacterota bacterium]
MTNRVVITGIGPVSSIGTGKDIFFRNLLDLKLNISEIFSEFKGYKYKSRFVSPMPEFSLEDMNIPSSIYKILQDEDKLTLKSAKLALDDAHIDLKEISECSIILGTGFSGLQRAFESYLVHIGVDEKRFHRMIIPQTMPNSVAAWLSIIFKIKGSSFTINASCASGTIAIGEAYLKIKNGNDKIIITGGVECLKDKHGAIRRGFDVLDTLTKDENGVPYPFSKNRSGFLFNEGAACILILENLDNAIIRKADIYAEITDYKSNSDSFNIVQIEPSGESIKNLLISIINKKKIDYINTHGTGTIPNDEVESRIIREIFGNKNNQPFLNSSKGILGHTLGASGAFETAITALSIKESKLHPNNIPEPMENLNLIPEKTESIIHNAITTSYGFGGHNAALFLKRIEL